MKIKITNKNDIVEIIQKYFNTSKEDREYYEIRFCFAHKEDRDRALESEISVDETIEVNGEDALTEIANTIYILDIKETFRKIWTDDVSKSVVKTFEKLDEIERRDLPTHLDFYICFSQNIMDAKWQTRNHDEWLE